MVDITASSPYINANLNSSVPSSQPPLIQPTRLTSKPPARARFRVAVASQGQSGLDDVVSPMFGRSPTFTIVDIEDNEIKGVNVIQNQAASAVHGAGIAAVQTLANLGVNILIAGRFGPNAYMVCNQVGIRMVEAEPGIRVRDAVQSLVSGRLRFISGPTAPMGAGANFSSGMGVRGGMGMGRGGGMGRGAGGGRGRMGGFGAGPSGFCVCPNCGYRVPHTVGMPCFRQICPKCGSRMIRER